MFISLQDRLEDPIVQELIEYATLPEQEYVLAALKEYKEQEAMTLYGFEDEEQLVALIGIEKQNQEVKIKHLAVLPENRLKDYGRGIISEMIGTLKPEIVTAEIEEDAVDFFRNIGFMVYSLGEKYPGVEHFRCVFEVEEEE
ncbi:GNAT family N-acetyltransferase [Paenibacillus polygoni]|uniref:GNAT family N-acetyltransferase n=1 Tax=Paenibacillus polygoni TaxID=3050112 RepID=A0ABY8XB72_9BACL|nr:GNAT family N-acetyltransferase [Paenibacillus polygoni]WIV20711.1 GNAT family N-acetyltransferase [Paenibacillus polygoni]